ncbi:MAG: NADH-quinone oxidoreductase subunit NuoF [Candidatus Hydromicrobium americanum]|nr:MAG: NADH-quinone oxidoreductase subunit NuoF [Candidatus Hydromicrobium americanum]
MIKELKSPLRVVLENYGRINPESIEEYIAQDGYEAVGKVLREMRPEQVLSEIKASGLQGRGGAAFPTGLKWEFTAKAKDAPKYIICNADEGEPGTFKDRAILEGDPHKIIEGMIIAGYAVGAHYGYIYIRGEYLLSINRFNKALKQAREHRFLGEDVFGSGFNFQIEIHQGAGSYVCGEETALMESLEGKRGNPRFKPPFPPSSGLWGKPTLINNVETLANIAPIILKGSDWFRTFGTKKCPGTKVYAISGHVKEAGLIEAPMGITLREIIIDYAQGMRDSKFKMAQVGGTAGAILGEDMLDVPLDYASLGEKGLVLGSGAILVMDETTCALDMLECFLNFFKRESCGKCIPCRVGTEKLLELATAISRGEGKEDDIDLMLHTAKVMQKTSLCALGQSLILPISTTLKYSREEVTEHIKGRCPTGVCKI